jgi:hypothetical protein
MRLILLALIVGVLAYLFFEQPADFPFTLNEMRYGAALLVVLLSIEGVLSFKSSSGQGRVEEGAEQELSEGIANLRAQLGEFIESFQSSTETIAGLRGALAEAEARLKQAESTAALAAEAVVNTSEDSSQDQEEAVPPDYSQLVSFLAVLQGEGRLVDFLMQDITGYDDQRVAAVARFVQGGSQRALNRYLKISSVYTGSEGDPISLPSGFDSVSFRVAGQVSSKPPYQGKVLHRGWRIDQVELPKASSPDQGVGGESPLIITPVEVEI